MHLCNSKGAGKPALHKKGDKDMKAENRGQLVRGKIAVGYWRATLIGSDYKTFEEMDSRNNIVAVTPWFRHDDDLTKCDKALEMLVKCYRDMPNVDGSMLISYEYRDYSK